MNSEPDVNLTPEQARDQLAATRTLATPHDRLVHGLSIAVYGCLMGAFISVDRVVDGTDLESVTMVGYVLLLLSVPWAQQRFARTAPLHSKRISYWGIGGSLVLSFVGIGLLNARAGQAEHDGLIGWTEHGWLLVLVAVGIALPCLVAGHLIKNGSRR